MTFSQFPELAIFCGSVHHYRYMPHRYRFRQPLLMFFVNTDKIDALVKRLGWFARLGAVNWRRQDYLPDGGRSLTAAALAALYDCSGARASGPVYVLAQPRQFGSAYNPAAFYFICDGDDRQAVHLLVEVHNTPWGERFCYAGSYKSATIAASTMQKRRRVSPFNPPQMTYEWRYNQPRRNFFIRMRCRHDSRLHFEATLLLKRQPFSSRRLAAGVARQPFSAAAGFVAIYWHALRLWLKKTPLYREQFAIMEEQD